MALTTTPVADASQAPATVRRAAVRGLLPWVGLGAAIAVLAWMLVLAARGVAGRFVPVLWWDSWSGLAGFEQAADQGDFWSALWAPHNSHRIVLTRLLYLGARAFGEHDLLVLIVSNCLLALALAAALTALTWRMLPSRGLRVLLAVLSMVACTSWVHWENLTWEFQSQLILVPMFAVLSFWAAGVGADRGRGRRALAWFALATGCSLLALLSMSPGATVPVVLVGLMLCLRVPPRLLVAVAAIVVVAVGLYLNGLTDTGAAWAPPIAMELTPARVVLGFLVFLGGPLAIVTKSLVAAGVAGAVMAVGGAVFGFLAAAGRLRPAEASGVAVVVFTMGTAVLAAYLRLGSGFAAMVASRYQFIVVAAWVALAALVISRVPRRRPRLASAAVCAGALLLLLAPFQLAAVEGSASRWPDDRPPLWPPTVWPTSLFRYFYSTESRLPPALGIALGVRDMRAQVPRLYYESKRWPELSGYARAAGIGVFGGSFRELASRLGTREPGAAAVPCSASVLTVEQVPGDPAWSRVSGWAYESADDRVPSLVALLGADSTVAGYAVTGTPIGATAGTGVAGPTGRAAERAGFSGYVRSVAAADLDVVCLAGR